MEDFILELLHGIAIFFYNPLLHIIEGLVTEDYATLFFSQEEYQRQRTQLEENYESYRHIFESTPSNRDAVDGGDNDDDAADLNPFDDATEDEIASIESVLDGLDGQAATSAPDVNGGGGQVDQDELERQTITVGSADFDEYDASGKNPFF